MEQKILNLLASADYTPLNVAELSKRLGLTHNQRTQLAQKLAQLEQRGRIARIKAGNRYALPLEADLVPGHLRMNRQGVGFLQPTQPNTPVIRVSPDATSVAMHGDRVLVRRDAAPRLKSRERQAEATGRVVRILERARTKLVGTLQQGRRFLYVVPDDPRITQDIYVAPATDVGRPARAGDKVVVELREWK